MGARAARAALLALGLAAPAAAAGGPKLAPEAERLLEEGVRELYELDYADSRAAFRRLVELEPENPFGYLFEAGGIWWQSSQEYGLFKATPTLEGLFERDIEAALAKARAYLGSEDPELRADGHFVSGMAYGTRGQWNVMKGRWLAAYFDGKKSVRHLKRCLKLDPGYHDAYLGLGLFDYQVARFSGGARLGALLGGMRGDEKRGLERIRQAVERSRYAHKQAAQLLANLYLVDLREDSKALPLLQRLRGFFPGSPYFVFLEALARHRLGELDASAALGRELFAFAQADPAAFRRKELTLACGLSLVSCLGPADAEGFAAWSARALEASYREKPSPYQTWLRLLRGHALDLLGRREQAVAEYERAAALPPFDDAHARAKSCLEMPCGREVLLGLLRERSGQP